jgi:hypothetical protein
MLFQTKGKAAPWVEDGERIVRVTVAYKVQTSKRK